MDLQNVIFDLDGTLVDSLPGIEYAVDQALQATGRKPRQATLRALIGPPIREVLSKTADETDPAILDTLEKAFRQSYDAEGWTKTTLNPGAREVLDWLKQTNRRAYLLTNKPKPATTQILENFALTEAFSQVLCQSKSALLHALINAEGLTAQNSILVVDTQEDLDVARQAGMPVAIVKNGYGNFQNPPPLVLADLSQLRPLFEKWGGAPGPQPVPRPAPILEPRRN